jgi:hypothetical protein
VKGATVSLTDKEQARLSVAEAILEVFPPGHGLPGAPGFTTEMWNRVSLVVYRGDRQMAVLFLPPATFEERITDQVVSAHGRAHCRPATDEEWELLLGHLPRLLR